MCQKEDHNSLPNYVSTRPYGSKARKTFAGSSGPCPPASMPLGDLGAPRCAPDMANHDAKQVSGKRVHAAAAGATGPAVAATSSASGGTESGAGRHTCAAQNTKTLQVSRTGSAGTCRSYIQGQSRIQQKTRKTVKDAAYLACRTGKVAGEWYHIPCLSPTGFNFTLHCLEGSRCMWLIGLRV